MSDLTERDAAPLEALHARARDIFSSAIEACSIDRAMAERVRFDGTTLVVEHRSAETPAQPPIRVELARYRKVLVIALGKAALSMLESLLEKAPRKLRIRGICCGLRVPEHGNWRIRYFAGGHPLPNEDSFRAARTALRLLRKTTERTFVVYLISGGGSTLFDLPLDPAISLSDTVAFHQALIGSGAPIAEINTLRKHFSAVKGGRLATAAPCAEKLTLQIVDTPVRDPSTVASGPTLPDASTVGDCRTLIARYRLAERLPAAVRDFFARPDLPETPGRKPVTGPVTPALDAVEADPPGMNTQLATLLSNRDLVEAARQRAVALGYRVVVDNRCDDQPYDQAAAYLVDRLARLRAEQKRVCLISGGEVTVTLDRTPGTGGRNQHFALACALLFAQRFPGERVLCLSAGSDGIDGNSPVAGAIADATTVQRAQEFGYNPQGALSTFDACPLFTALGDTVSTGPTANNLRDLRILISG